MADSLQDDDYDDLGLEQLEQGRKSQQIFFLSSQVLNYPVVHLVMDMLLETLNKQLRFNSIEKFV